jgi:hypothetical protein
MGETKDKCSYGILYHQPLGKVEVNMKSLANP